MSCYISSSENRFYAAIEPQYGTAATVTETNRIPGGKLKIHEEVKTPRRLDKTGSRTFVGVPNGFRRRTTFELTALMTGWTDTSGEPAYGPLFQGALGSLGLHFGGGTVQASQEPTRVTFASAHGLQPGQAVSYGGDIRFVASVADAASVTLNAPFSSQPQPGDPVGATVTYLPGARLPSVSVFDFWDPVESVQRILTGGAVDRLELGVNGDFHQFTFKGIGRELVDSASFSDGQAGLSTFPVEPPSVGWNFSLVPGNLGQVWIGATASQYFSIIEAQIALDNNLETRSKEFGLTGPQCIAPGMRSVEAAFRLYANTEAGTKELYQAARQRSPMSMMMQLGQTTGHLCGVYMKSFVPEVPDFDDEENRLQWRFKACRAQGTVNDELAVAFG
jgi:hypothetical protein